MSYQHMFYGVDLDRLKAIYGSNNQTLLNEILQAKAEDLEGNDDFFDYAIEDGTSPNSETALRAIFAGESQPCEEPSLHGYVFKFLCEHVGTRFGEDVAEIQEHPYKSLLVASGPPIPIPYDRSSAPQIGHLSLQQIPDEIKRIDAAPRKAKRSFQSTVVLPILGWFVSLFLKGFKFRQFDDESTVEDMNAYRNTLQEALDKGMSIVSFRH